MTPLQQRFLLLIAGVALLASVPFLFGLPGQFLFDDIPNIVNNASIQITDVRFDTLFDLLSTRQISGTTRGLPTLSFALDFWRAGGVAAPFTFKATNIAIHAITACALTWFFRSLLTATGLSGRKTQWLPIALSLAWALHPLQVSSVLYAVQRLQTMGTLFLVLALIAYLHGRTAQRERRSGRASLLLALLAWAAALNCKEDSALFPAYTLAMELTVLRFAAADVRTETLWRRGYLLATAAATTIYLLWIIPSYWQTDPYPDRNFNTLERLLTEPRVLCLYLWQVLLPLPQHMPFFYDWVQPSRGLLQPWTTLPALMLVAALPALAWRQRHRAPLFALGVFLYFGAHVVTSNVVGLELAYEHRNHFALIGAVLAAGVLLARTARRLSIPANAQIGLVAAGLLVLGSATALRAHAWRSNVTLARASTQAAPQSPRAWIELCDAYVKAGGGAVRDNPYLDDAIAACTSGADASSASLNNLALLTVLKTVRGDIVPQDWTRLQQRLEIAQMSWDNIRAPLILTHYAGQGVALDKAQILVTMATLDRRVSLQPGTLVTIGDAIMDTLDEPDLALPYYTKALRSVPPGDAFAWELADKLRAHGRGDLIRKVEQAARVAPGTLTSPTAPADA